MYYKDNQTYTESEIKALYPNTSFPSPFVAPEEFSVIFDTPNPTITDLQVAYQDGTEVDALGNRVVKWTVSNKFTTVEEENEYLLQKQTDAIANAIKSFTVMTTEYIESKVQAYNEANGLAFKDIDAFAKYAMNPLSTHYVIANRFINYADAVWNAVRVYQSTATAIPTQEEFQNILDSVVF